jgi:hypothetical protein
MSSDKNQQTNTNSAGSSLLGSNPEDKGVFTRAKEGLDSGMQQAKETMESWKQSGKNTAEEMDRRAKSSDEKL